MEEWEKQERHIAKRSGGRRQPGSGSGWLHPNDIKADDVLWEAKQGAKMVTIKSADWEKLRRNAYASGRKPGMHIQIGKRRLVLLDESVLDV